MTPDKHPPHVAAVSTCGLRLSYGEVDILRGIDISLRRGETLALLGPSGCGKTTLLRLVAGLLAPSAGTVAIEGRVVAGDGQFLPPEKRGLGMVFQDYALWPHLTVARNVAFPLDMARVPQAQGKARVAAALDRVGLSAFSDRNPSALSGGQQQRVAIARAIVAEPKIVLFDEPLSNLDRELRESMVAELGALIRGLGLTAIYVTHDQSEALSLADQVAVMDAGLIAQLATPDELVEHPASAKVAEFLRLGKVFNLSRSGDNWLAGQHALGIKGGPDAQHAQALVTPNAIAITPVGSGSLTGLVTAVQYRETAYAVTVQLEGAEALSLQVSSSVRMRIGERIGLEILSDRLRWFPEQTLAPT